MLRVYETVKLPTRKEALEYIRTSEPDMPIYQKSLLVLNLVENRRTRVIAWISLTVAILSMVFSLVLKKL